MASELADRMRAVADSRLSMTRVLAYAAADALDAQAEEIKRLNGAYESVDIERNRQALEIKRLKKALVDVEEHHVYLNSRRGRKFEKSHTLAIVRAALNGGTR